MLKGIAAFTLLVGIVSCTNESEDMPIQINLVHQSNFDETENSVVINCIGRFPESMPDNFLEQCNKLSIPVRSRFADARSVSLSSIPQNPFDPSSQSTMTRSIQNGSQVGTMIVELTAGPYMMD